MFYTEVDIPEYPFRITYKDNLFWIGSCFTTNIGEAMKTLKFHCEVNPFGALYNPISILSGLKIILNKQSLTGDDLFERNELWNSFLFHSSFSNPDKTTALDNMNKQLKEASANLFNCNYLFITFGTAYSFILKNSGQIVGNCHKIPAREFDHIRLSINYITEEYNTFIKYISKLLPGIKIVFSVSPIRHFKDGAHNNQISKSILLMAIDEIVKTNENCFYFPSYEIVLDELRDYRFYSKDMCHLSETAIEHILNKFTDTVIDADTHGIMKEIAKLNTLKAHRTFNANTNAHKKFIESIDLKEGELKNKYPYLNWV